MSGEHKWTAQIMREAVASAMKDGMTIGTDRLAISLDAAIQHLRDSFKKIEPSLFVDLDNDTSGTPSGLILANDRASLYAAIQVTARALVINRDTLGKAPIVVPLMIPDATERIIAALALVIGDFESWSIGSAQRNGRVRR